MGAEVYLFPWSRKLPQKLRLYVLGTISNPSNLARLIQTILASVPLASDSGVPEAALCECVIAYAAYLRGVRPPIPDSEDAVAQPVNWMAKVPDNPQDPASNVWVGADTSKRPFPH